MADSVPLHLHMPCLCSCSSYPYQTPTKLLHLSPTSIDPSTHRTTDSREQDAGPLLRNPDTLPLTLSRALIESANQFRISYTPLSLHTRHKHERIIKNAHHAPWSVTVIIIRKVLSFPLARCLNGQVRNCTDRKRVALRWRQVRNEGIPIKDRRLDVNSGSQLGCSNWIGCMMEKKV